MLSVTQSGEAPTGMVPVAALSAVCRILVTQLRFKIHMAYQLCCSELLKASLSHCHQKRRKPFLQRSRLLLAATTKT